MIYKQHVITDIHYVILKWFMNQRGQTLPWSQASTVLYHSQTGG